MTKRCAIFEFMPRPLLIAESRSGWRSGHADFKTASVWLKIHI